MLASVSNWLGWRCGATGCLSECGSRKSRRALSTSAGRVCEGGIVLKDTVSIAPPERVEVGDTRLTLVEVADA